MPPNKNKKISFNPSYENYYILQDARNRTALPLTTILNNYIDFTTSLDPSIKTPLVEYIDQEIISRKKIQSYESKLMAQNLELQITQLTGLKNLLINYSSTKEMYCLEKINLKEGFLQYPKDWILVNPDDANKHMRAYVVECRNSEKYKIPHYIYFDDLCERDESFYKKVESEIVKIDPKFKKIIEMQVNAEYKDGEARNYWNITNKDEYFEAPTIGIFLVQTLPEIREIRLWDPKYVPPANIQIIK